MQANKHVNPEIAGVLNRFLSQAPFFADQVVVEFHPLSDPHADTERFLAESCEDCGQHVPSEGHSQRCIERAAERERCGYCGQDHCECESRYGVVQGIVSARAKGGHLTPERMKSLGEFIVSQFAREDAARDTLQGPEVTPEPVTPFD